MMRVCTRNYATVALLLALLTPGFTALAADTPGDQYAARARQILDDSGVTGGLVVHLGCNDGRLTAALRSKESYLVQGVDADTRSVEKAALTA